MYVILLLVHFCSEENEIYSVVSERKKYEKFKLTDCPAYESTKFELTDCPAYESNKFELVTCPAYYPVANTVDEEESYVIMWKEPIILCIANLTI